MIVTTAPEYHFGTFYDGSFGKLVALIFGQGTSDNEVYLTKSLRCDIVSDMSHGRNTSVIGVRIQDSVYARIKVLAEKEGWSVSDWLKSVIIRAAGLLPDGSIRSHHKGRS